MDIIRHKYTYLAIAGVVILASLISFAVWGLKPGIDFTGGSFLEAEFLSKPDTELVRQSLEELAIGTIIVQSSGEKSAIIRFATVDEPTHQEILRRLSNLQGGMHVEEKRFDTIGPTIGQELKRRSFLAVIFAVIGIVLYIAWAFRQVSKPLPSWKYGIVAIATLIHDVVIPIGLFAALGRFKGVEVDPLFITALLTIMGFSVHDTIVVFDRTREHLRTSKPQDSYDRLVNRSVNETLARSINTTLTVILVLGAIFFFGGVTVHYFALALAVGIGFGTYSSIFVASPLLVVWNNLTKKR